jgi:hypothetical protein
MHAALAVAVAIALCGCARSATMQLSADTFQLVTSAAPVCGRAGAQNVAARRAAIETINRGYDKFLILGAAAENNVRVVGHTPVQAHTVGTATATGYGNMVTASGQSTTTYTGGNPIIGGSHDQGLIVKMFKDADPKGANAISARATLGPKWQEAIKESAATTC